MKISYLKISYLIDLQAICTCALFLLRSDPGANLMDTYDDDDETDISRRSLLPEDSVNETSLLSELIAADDQAVSLFTLEY